MRIFCWNVNSLVPTVRNINLKYGSLTKFFQELDADIVCMQVQCPVAYNSDKSDTAAALIARTCIQIVISVQWYCKDIHSSTVAIWSVQLA